MVLTVVQIIIGLFILGILVLVHEFGHFIFAKLFGIRVTAFSIGFGRPLVHKQIGETDYRISMIPFGGYVHMAGENPDDEREHAPDEFPSKPIWQRALVAIGGPGANYLFALLFLWMVFIIGEYRPLYLDRPVIGAVEDSSAAAYAGFMPGDSIISVNGNTVDSWEECQKKFALLKQSYTIDLIRNGQRKKLTLTVPRADDGTLPEGPTGGLYPAIPPIVGSVKPGAPADRAGFENGDSIVAINDKEMHSWIQVSERIASYDSSSETLAITVYRNDSLFTSELRPEYDKDAGRFLIGIGMGEPPSRTVRWGPFAALPKSIVRSGEITGNIFDILGRLFTGKVSPKNLAGPIGIVQMSGNVAFLGLTRILNFMALIGINLALLNLLPLIITDGGMLMFLGIEAVRGKPLSVKHQMLINRIAIFLFILLFLYVSFNDVLRFPRFLNFGSK
jgi:regulator of sigma E protease